MAAIRRAEVTWNGTLQTGRGTASAVSSGAFSDLPVSWAARTVTFDKLDAGWRVVSSALTVRGVVPGISSADFTAAAESARDTCPISVALKGNVALSVDAALDA
jgi:hypothetical protein